jgi:hypothetical protein
MLMPCRCRSRIITTSPRVTNTALPRSLEAMLDYGDDPRRELLRDTAAGATAEFSTATSEEDSSGGHIPQHPSVRYLPDLIGP